MLGPDQLMQYAEELVTRGEKRDCRLLVPLRRTDHFICSRFFAGSGANLILNEILGMVVNSTPATVVSTIKKFKVRPTEHFLAI